MITIKRTTKETDIFIQLEINSSKKHIEINTGLPFFDHMLDQLATHAGWSLIIKVKADYQVDDHHGIEDVAICLGQVVFKAWKAQSNKRYGQRLLPMDECLTTCAIDLCGRPFCVANLPFSQDRLGHINTEMWQHFFYTFAINAQICLHINNQYFKNNHHLIESAFKALAYAFKEALQPAEASTTTKGLL